MKINLGGTIHLVVQGMCVSSSLDRRKSIMVMEFEICSADYIHRPNMYKVAWRWVEQKWVNLYYGLQRSYFLTFSSQTKAGNSA